MVLKDDGVSTIEMKSLTGKKNKESGGDSGGAAQASLLKNLCTICGIYIGMYPKIFCIFTSVIIISIMLLLVIVKANYLDRNVMQYDYSSLVDHYNFKTAKIDHWCVFGNDDKCECEDPNEGITNDHTKGWIKSHRRNLGFIYHYMKNMNLRNGLDVVFVGDDVVEELVGYNTLIDGETNNIVKPKMARNWKLTYGNNETSGNSDSLRGTTIGTSEPFPFSGLSLGIAGDRTPNLLWRLKHGEMLKNVPIKPKVWWISTGSNDLSMKGCSEEVVTLGILRVAEELAFEYPDSYIVIQALLPQSNNRDGRVGYDKRIRNYEGTDKPKHASHKGATATNSNGAGFFHANKTIEKIEKHFDLNSPPSKPLPSIQVDSISNTLTNNVAPRLNTLQDNEEAFDDDSDEVRNRKLQLQQPLSPEKNFVPSTSFGQSSMQTQIQSNVGVDVKKDEPSADVPKTIGVGWEMPPKPTQRKHYYQKHDLWPSIRAINKELELFCKKHDKFIYFDSTALFLGTVGNRHYQQSTKQIIDDLMPDYVHLSYDGYKVLLRAITRELQRILLEGDDANDIEGNDKS